MTDREIMQQALDALEYHTMQTRPISHTDKAIEALRQALAQPEQDPVLWKWSGDGWSYEKPIFPATPLYTAPPRKLWVGLTDDEIKGILDCGRGGMVDIKKAEQILKDKNGG